MKGCDTNQPITAAIAKALKERGDGFIFRYLRRSPRDGSLLTKNEVSILSSFEFWIGMVFQHRSNRPDLFTHENGDTDGQAAVARAKEIDATPGSAIYAACDCDFTKATLHHAVDYFAAFAPIVKRAGFKVGVYGDDLVAQTIFDQQLAEHGWLTNAKGWLTLPTFANWDVNQTSLPYAPFTTFPRFEIDDDELRATPQSAGLWLP